MAVDRVAGASGAAPNWRRLALVFAAAMGCDLAAWAQIATYTPIYLRSEFGMSPDDVSRWTGWLMAATLAMAAPLGPVWGALADRYGRKPLIARGFFISTIAQLVTAWAPTVEWLLVARLIFGLAFGISGIMLAAQSEVTPEAQLGRAFGWIQMMEPIGKAIAPLYGAALLIALGPRGLHLIAAAHSAVACGLIWFGMQEARRAGTGSVGKQLHTAVSQIAREPALIAAFTVMALIGAGSAILDPYVPVFLDQLAVGVDPAIFVGVTMSMFWLVTGLATPWYGRQADRFGAAKLLGLALLGLIAMAALMAMPAPFGAPPGWWLAALQVLRGAAMAGTVALAFLLVVQATPMANRASILAFSVFPRHLANFFAPLAGAALAPLGAHWLFLVAAACYAMAWASLQRVKALARRDSIAQ